MATLARKQRGAAKFAREHGGEVALANKQKQGAAALGHEQGQAGDIEP
jgi:hypothetical protein